MTAARFLVKLRLTYGATAQVERQIRRTDQERAVFFAQNWLLQTQRLELYFGVTYRVYEIYKQDDNGDWINIDTGSVQDAETGRAKTRAQSSQKETPSAPRKGGRMAERTGAGKDDDPRSPLFVTDKLPGTPKRGRHRAPLSPLRQRMMEMQALAKQALAEKKAREGK